MTNEQLPQAGERWAYRKASHLPATEVEILGTTENGRKVRVEIRHLDDGRTEVVTPGKVPVKWDDLESLLKSEETWRWLTDFELHEVEEYAIMVVFEDLVTEPVASIDYSSRRHVATVHDIAGFETLLDGTLDDLARRAPVDREGAPRLGREATLVAAELICRRDPQPILDWIYEREEKSRHNCKHGAKRDYKHRDDDPDKASPEEEWHWYITYDRPRLELLRQWCGFRAVTADERRRAAEAEARRLDLLVTEVITALAHHDKSYADSFAREHETKRITPARVRPQIDRPLSIEEMPVREIRVRSRGWW